MCIRDRGSTVSLGIYASVTGRLINFQIEVAIDTNFFAAVAGSETIGFDEFATCVALCGCVKYAEVAHAFARCSGKQLSCEWVGDVQQWIEAAGGTADDGKYIYDAFHAMHLREKGKK